MAQVNQAGTPILLTASGVVSSTGGSLIGFFCATTSSGTVVIREGGASGTAVSGTITPNAGVFYAFPAQFTGGCYFTIANTISVTAFFAAS